MPRLDAEAGVDAARGLEKVVILRDEALAASGDGDVDVGQAAALAGEEPADKLRTLDESGNF